MIIHFQEVKNKIIKVKFYYFLSFHLKIIILSNPKINCIIILQIKL